MRKYSVEKIPYTIYVHQGNGVSQKVITDADNES